MIKKAFMEFKVENKAFGGDDETCRYGQDEIALAHFQTGSPKINNGRATSARPTSKIIMPYPVSYSGVPWSIQKGNSRLISTFAPGKDCVIEKGEEKTR